ncbi:MAG TPA: KUP/HAK/KT family potassium transporter, partial [Lautropia sp.]|nr:KUP/HAK/KT family potassium transporter [Lautropia sp.]
MNVTAEGAAQPAPLPAVTEDSHGLGHHAGGPLHKLMLGAFGVVFGDIGTSPIYAFRETFAGHHTLEPDRLHIYGVLSLIFWSMMIIVTLKYVTILLRADNKGEGGTLALLALINRSSGDTRRWSAGIVMLGVFATALFYGDGVITPAISVLSAVEGLTTVEASFQPYVIPVSIGILVGLFAIQSRGTARVGNLFGPVMILYFSTLAVLGLSHVVTYPALLLQMLNPGNALAFYIAEPLPAFIALGSVVLAVTGAEAMYADMGHFGRRPIRFAWVFVLVALLLNYLGQGAMLLQQTPEAARELVKNPFFFLAPEELRLPLVLLATCATVIASQAVITGAFSVTQQAIQLGFIPRLSIRHTSEKAAGQIYIPVINWALMVMVILLVVSFGSSSNLAAAYGIAVTGAMFIDTLLLAVVFFTLWKWPAWKAVPLLALFLLVDLLYFSSNLMKVPDGGWFPLVVGVVIFTGLMTWAKGRKLMHDRMAEAAMPMDVFVKSASASATRVPGTAVFMTSSAKGVPHALLHNLKHNKVMHERVILLTVRIEDVPYVQVGRRVETSNYGSGFYRVVLHYGFMEEMNVPAELQRLEGCGPICRMIDTSFFLSR